jgi:hypothetical protein
MNCEFIINGCESLMSGLVFRLNYCGRSEEHSKSGCSRPLICLCVIILIEFRSNSWFELRGD